MNDPALDRRHSDCKELIASWKTFHDYFKIGVKGQELTAEKEAKFLEIKSKIAMLHDSFIDSLTHDQNIGQNIITIVSRCITLKHLHRSGPAEIKKMEIEWHESYLLLNETVAVLEEKRDTLAKVNPTQYKMDKFKERVSVNIKWFLTSIYLKIIIVLGVLGFLIIGVPLLGIYDYKNMRNTKAKAVYELGAGIYRMLDGDYPYDDIEQVDFNKNVIGNVFESKADPTDEDILKNLRYALPDLVNKVSAKTGFRGKYYTVNNNPIMWGEFLLPKTSDATEAVDMFKKWYDPMPTADKNNPNAIASKLLIYNKRNVLIIMFFHPQLRSNAELIRDQVYGIKSS